MKYIKFIRIFLLVLIIIGVGLLLTQKIWVPKVVDVILKFSNYRIYPEIQEENKINNISNSIFTNSEYGYSFEFPPNFIMNNVQGRQNVDQVIYDPVKEAKKHLDSYILIEVSPIIPNTVTNFEESEESFLKIINDDFGLRWRCVNGEGDDHSIKLTDIVEQTKVINKNNLLYYKTYLKQERFSEEGRTILGIVGPLYAFDIREKTNNKAEVIYVSMPINCVAKNSVVPATTELQNLIDSFKF